MGDMSVGQGSNLPDPKAVEKYNEQLKQQRDNPEWANITELLSKDFFIRDTEGRRLKNLIRSLNKNYTKKDYANVIKQFEGSSHKENQPVKEITQTLKRLATNAPDVQPKPSAGSTVAGMTKQEGHFGVNENLETTATTSSSSRIDQIIEKQGRIRKNEDSFTGNKENVEKESPKQKDTKQEKPIGEKELEEWSKKTESITKDSKKKPAKPLTKEEGIDKTVKNADDAWGDLPDF